MTPEEIRKEYGGSKTRIEIRIMGEIAAQLAQLNRHLANIANPPQLVTRQSNGPDLHLWSDEQVREMVYRGEIVVEPPSKFTPAPTDTVTLSNKSRALSLGRKVGPRWKETGEVAWCVIDADGSVYPFPDAQTARETASIEEKLNTIAASSNEYWRNYDPTEIPF